MYLSKISLHKLSMADVHDLKSLPTIIVQINIIM